MTTPQKDRQFIDDMIDHDLLERAIDWIARHYDPEDVFDEDRLREWALSNGMEEAP